MPTPPKPPPPPPEKTLELVELRYQELDEGLATFGGLMGIPSLLQSVGQMLGAMNGQATPIPPTWTVWLRDRIRAREPVVIQFSTATHVWECRIS